MARIISAKPAIDPAVQGRTLSPDIVDVPDQAGNAAGKAKRARRPTRSRRRIVLIVVVLVAVGLVAKAKFLKPHYGPGSTVPSGAIFALGSSTITTNLSDGHLAQIAVSLQLTGPANTREVNTDVPELTSSTVEILGQQTYAGLLDPAGREALAVALLHAYQRDLGTSEGAQQVSAVYFTNFVLQ